MKLTLLELTQDILNDLDSDEVNSIDDTVEASQVAQIIRTCYFEMIGHRNWPHLRKLVQMEAINDVTRPNYLVLPERLKELISFRYDKTRASGTNLILGSVEYKDPDSFLRFINGRNSSADNVIEVADHSGITLLVVDNAPPTYWTSFNDMHVVCDSYDKEVDDTLKKSKTECVAYINPLWVRSNDAIPDLPIEAFPALLEESKSTVFLALKQQANEKAEQKAKRQQAWLSRKAWSASGGIVYPNYGRK